MGSANKKETELLIEEAGQMLAQGHSSIVVTSYVTETYSISRRQARRITAIAFELLVQGLEATDISKPMMVSQLIANLQSCIQKVSLLYEIVIHF